MILTQSFVDEFRRANEERRNNGFGSLSDWHSREWVAALCGEAGEAANAAKKIRRLDAGLGDPNDRTQREHDYAEEIADCYVYADLVCIDQQIGTAEMLTNVSADFDVAKTEFESCPSPMVFWIGTCKIISQIDECVMANVVPINPMRKLLARLMVAASYTTFDFETMIREKFNTVSERVGVDIHL